MSESRSVEPEPVPRQLPEGYYAENFEVVLETVRERYRDLLRSGELAFFDDWSTLSLAARRLYVRLISRKGPCLRRDRIDYAEIPDIDSALTELAAAGFCDGGADVPAGELLVLLLRGELAAMARQLLDGDRPAAAARKDEILAALVAGADGAELGRELRRRVDVVRPLRRDVVLVFRLLFFGNLRQDWTEFVLRDLEVVRFEPYDLRTDLRLFPTRKALDDTLVLQLCRGEVSALLYADEMAVALELGRMVLERRDAWDPAARRHGDRIYNKLGRSLERAANRDPASSRPICEKALAFYEAAEAPPARERRARVLARLGRHGEALALCREIETAPRDETEVAFAPRFAVKLRRQLGENLVERRPRRPTVMMELEKKNGLAVEALALDAFADCGRPGFFSENWLWRSLFGLAFWDVVFTPVEGAFQHPFQYGPLDLSTPEFRKARAALVDQRLAELEASPDPGARLLAVWDEKRGTANWLVAWGDELRPRLELALERLSGEHLARVFDRLSRDLRRYRRGFPDLFVLRDEEPGFELYEVKAPGDQLRPEQGAWIDYLNANGLPASVLRLVWG